MKKFTALILALALTMGLCACDVTILQDTGSATVAETPTAETDQAGEDVTFPEDNGGLAGVYKWVEMEDNGVTANLIIYDDGTGIIDMLGVVETVTYDDNTMQSSGEGAVAQDYTYADGTLTWITKDEEQRQSTFVKLTEEELAEYKARGVGNAGEPAKEPADEASGDVVVLFTSDIHCGVDQNFTLAGLKQVQDTLEKWGTHTLLVDDGDAIQGEALGTITKGEAIINLMNAVGYDVAIPGNHEFDYGMDRFLELADMAEYPYISCNFNKEGEPVFDPYVILEAGGIKIGFVGVTTPETLTSSTPKYFQDDKGNYIYGFLQDETGQAVYDAVQSAVDAARADGADYVFVMGHVGNEAACEPWTYADIIANTTGIDAFMDGHSHDTDHVVMQNKSGEDVPRQACGTKLSGIGWVRISAEDGAVTTGLYSWANKDATAPELFGFDNEISEAISKETAGLKEELSKVVAVSEAPLTIYDPEATDENGQPIRIVRRAETNLGDLCADALRDQLGTDIALMNGGGVRASIEEGDITLNDIMKVQPYGNMESAVEATGQQILDALEWGARSVPEELGGFMQVSGLTYEIHTYIESSCTSDDNGMFTGVDGEYRVKNVMVGDEPLDLKKNILSAVSIIFCSIMETDLQCLTDAGFS